MPETDIGSLWHRALGVLTSPSELFTLHLSPSGLSHKWPQQLILSVQGPNTSDM